MAKLIRGLAKLLGAAVLLAGGIRGGLGYLQNSIEITWTGVAIGLVGLLVLMQAFRDPAPALAEPPKGP